MCSANFVKMRYTPYSRDLRGNDKVTNNLSKYFLPHHHDEVSDLNGNSKIKIKQEPEDSIQEHPTRHFTPLTTMIHHRAGSDGSCSPSSAGSPVRETVTVKNIKQDFSDIEVSTNTGCAMCAGCGTTITDRYFLKIGKGRSWHVHCLHCSACHGSMGGDIMCYVKEGQAYCKMCYSRQFGVKCSSCSRTIQSTDWVRRAKDSVFHLACFACDSCKRQLSTGEEFAMVDCNVVCKTHYLEMLDVTTGGGSGNDDNGSSYGSETGEKYARPKNKRVRTTFSDNQVEILQANFNMDSNPDGQDLERVARITGLSKRVTQVWFQNSRARQKKYNVSTSMKQDKDDNKIMKTSTAPRREPCRKCDVVYCKCRAQQTSCRKVRFPVPTSPPTMSSTHQPDTNSIN